MFDYDFLYWMLIAAVFGPILAIFGVAAYAEVQKRSELRAATLANLNRGYARDRVSATLGGPHWSDD